MEADMSSTFPTTVTGRVSSPAPLRLTRRGRIAVVAALLAMLSTLGGLVGHAATAGADQRQAVRHVTVRPGETLWQLAERVAPGADPRVVVAQLAAINHLPGDGVAAGQRLIVSGVSR